MKLLWFEYKAYNANKQHPNMYKYYAHAIQKSGMDHSMHDYYVQEAGSKAVYMLSPKVQA